jgi:hypothetical protein
MEVFYGGTQIRNENVSERATVVLVEKLLQLST